MTAGRDVANAQIADRHDSGALGDDRRLTDRESRPGADRTAEPRDVDFFDHRMRIVPDRLARAGDQIDVCCRVAVVGEKALHDYQAAKRAHKAEWMKMRAGAQGG